MLNWTEKNFGKAFLQTSRSRLTLVSLICAVVLPGVGFFAPAVVSYFYYRLHILRCRRELSQFFRIFRQTVCAGCSLQQAFELCAEHLSGPLKFELRYVLNAIMLGQGTSEAIRDLTDRIGGNVMQKFGASIIAAHATGADIASALDHLAEQADARSLQVRGEIFWYLRSLFLLAIVFFYLNPVSETLGITLAAGLAGVLLALVFAKIILLTVRTPTVVVEPVPEITPAEEPVVVEEVPAAPVIASPVSNVQLVESFRELLADPAISEITLTGPEQITVVKHGSKVTGAYRFASYAKSSAALKEIFADSPVYPSEMNPILSTPIDGDLYVDVILEPLVLERFVKIRKIGYSAPQSRLVVDEDNRSLLDLLRIVTEAGANILVSTEHGVSREEVFELVTGMVHAENRLAVMEAQPRIKVIHADVIRLRPRLANIEGNGAITMAQLSQSIWNLEAGTVVLPDGHSVDVAACLDNAVRRNTQILIGVTDVSSRSAIEGLVERNGISSRKILSAGFNFILQVSRGADGAARISQLTEVWGMVGDVISLQDIFVFKEMGLDKNRKVVGQTLPTGLIPGYVDRLERRGIVIPRNIFAPRDR